MQYNIPKYAEQLKFKVIMLTPERAQQLLDNNHPDNRNLKEAKIRQMVNDIEEDGWKLTPEPVVVTDEGILIDGQNRCAACVRSGIAIPVVLCTGLPMEIIVAMDCGTSRNVADAAKILGKDIKNVALMSAIARRMATGMASRDRSMSIQEVLAWIENHKRALEFSYWCLRKHSRDTAVTGVTQSAVHAVIARAYYLRPVEETRARLEEFGEVLVTSLPNKPKEDSAAIRLRNWLQDHFTRGRRTKTKGARVSPLLVYAKTEIALLHFLNHEPVESLRETSVELFNLPGEKDLASPELAEDTVIA